MKNELFYANHIYAAGRMGAQLRGLSLSLFAGEVLGLYGNRHEGKGALAQVMLENAPLTGGSIQWNGAAGRLRPPMARITKNFALIDGMPIWENVTMLLGKRVMGGALNRSRQKNMVRLCLEDYGLPFDPEQKAGNLSQLEKVCIEALAALRRKVKILVIDLNGIDGTVREHTALKHLLDRLRREDVAVMISSHQAEIVSLLCDRIAMIYGGRIIKEFAGNEISAQELEALTLNLYQVKHPARPEVREDRECVLKVQALETGPGKTASFSLYRGELAALVSPQRELFQLLRRKACGSGEKSGGTILLHGAQLTRAQGNEAIFFLDTQYLGHVIEDLSPLENLCLGLSDKAGLLGFENKSVVECMERDFYGWYGHEGLLRSPDSRALNKIHRVAINLFRLRFLKAQVIFCNALNVHRDVVSCRLAEEALMELVREGTSVCMLLNDLSYRDEMIERYITLDEDG